MSLSLGSRSIGFLASGVEGSVARWEGGNTTIVGSVSVRVTVIV